MNYNDMIKELVNSDVPETERANQLIRAFCRVVDALLDYQYTVDHYNGDTETVLTDKIGTIKNAMIVAKTDMSLYMELVGITEKVDAGSEKRIIKILRRVRERG